mmetsp:Transcript_27634/g.76484  ORF Transcript_27634/g.76484 Transcript_27634/m.76484 type:complete len:144 (+) Transcript_27634:80-511(+)
MTLRLATPKPVAMTWLRLGASMGVRVRGQARFFCLSTRPPVETRVIWAVQRFVRARKEELLVPNGSVQGSPMNEHQRLVEQLGSEVTSATTWNDLGLDELDRIEVLLEVEEEFGHTIPDNVADDIQSVSQTVQYLQGEVDTHI